MNDAQQYLFDTTEYEISVDTCHELTSLAVSDTDDDECEYKEKRRFDEWRHELREK